MQATRGMHADLGGLSPHPMFPFTCHLRPGGANPEGTAAAAVSCSPHAAMQQHALSPLHPAFSHPAAAAYHLYQGGLLAMRPAQLLQQQIAEHKGKSFTIDAILGADKRDVDDRLDRGRLGSAAVGRRIPGGEQAATLQAREEAGMRRHDRPESSSHPYVAAINCPSALRGYGSLQFGLSAGRGDKNKSAGGWRGKTKRVRTIFTPEQLERLETEFERQQYMVGTERYYLAASLNLTEAQVKVWFQNRRIKWRKQNLEQQHAKLANLELFNEKEEGSDSDIENGDRKLGGGDSYGSEDMAREQTTSSEAESDADVDTAVYETDLGHCKENSDPLVVLGEPRSAHSGSEMCDGGGEMDRTNHRHSPIAVPTTFIDRIASNDQSEIVMASENPYTSMKI